MQTYWMHKLYKYWEEEDTTYSGDFDFWPEWLFQYYNELSLGESSKSAYLVWNSEQHRLTPKYYIMTSLVPLVKYYNVTMEEYYNQFKIICKHCDVCLTYDGWSGELL